MLRSVILLCMAIIIALLFHNVEGLSSENSIKATQNKLTDIDLKLQKIASAVGSLTTYNDLLSKNINELHSSEATQNLTLKRFENDIASLSNSKKSFESFSNYGDPIGLISVLVGVMTLVLTALAVITGVGFYKSHMAFERSKDTLISKALIDIDKRVDEYLKKEIHPKFQKKLDDVEIKFWQRTYIGMRLEHDFWMKLSQTQLDLKLLIDRNNKFKSAIAKILSEEDVADGLSFFSQYNKEDLPNSFEWSLYKLYQQGLFIKEKSTFNSLIYKLYSLHCDPWLNKIKMEPIPGLGSGSVDIYLGSCKIV